MEITLRAIEQAAARLQSIAHRTEQDRSSTFSVMAGGDIYLKHENLQKTGSFKIRGAANKIAALAERGEVRSVVASSAGNHAQGVAYAAARLGIPAAIVMPKAAPIAKVQATEGYGAEVVLHGDCYDDAYAKAVELCETRGATFVHPFNDPELIAGQGTIGLEILQDLPTVDMVLVPAGGGGLLAGVAACIKQLNPRVQVIGVQAEGADAIARSFREKRLISTDTVSTIADGIAVKCPGDVSTELIFRYVDDVVTVSDTEISEAILLLIERSKQIVEPAGATSLAAVLNGKVNVAGKRAVCVLSGGNIDVSFVHRIIELGLVSRHRRLRFHTTLLDQPGSLGRLLSCMAELGANIVMVQHDRLAPGLNPNEATVEVACEVGGAEHGQRVVSALEAQGFRVTLH